MKDTNTPGGGSFARYAFAALLICLGFMLLLRNTDVISYYRFGQIVSWQSLLMVLGVVALITRRFILGAVLICVGAYFSPLLTWFWPHDVGRYLWPLLIMVVGVAILIRPRRKAEYAEPEAGGTIPEGWSKANGGKVDINASFAGVRQIVVGPVFEGGAAKASFAGVCIDLRRTSLVAGETYLDLDFNMSGLELLVPSHWNVENRCNMTASAVNDKRGHEANPLSPTLVLRGRVALGGVEVKS